MFKYVISWVDANAVWIEEEGLLYSGTDRNKAMEACKKANEEHCGFSAEITVLGREWQKKTREEMKWQEEIYEDCFDMEVYDIDKFMLEEEFDGSEDCFDTEVYDVLTN